MDNYFGNIVQGLIALLAAVDSLSHVNGLDDLGKQVCLKLVLSVECNFC